MCTATLELLGARDRERARSPMPRWLTLAVPRRHGMACMRSLLRQARDELRRCVDWKGWKLCGTASLPKWRKAVRNHNPRTHAAEMAAIRVGGSLAFSLIADTCPVVADMQGRPTSR